ncbi:L protein, partial [Ekpoma virus 1]
MKCSHHINPFLHTDSLLSQNRHLHSITPGISNMKKTTGIMDYNLLDEQHFQEDTIFEFDIQGTLTDEYDDIETNPLFSIDLLNNKDYNLNSPLTYDGLEAFYSYLHTGSCNPLFFNQDFITLREWIARQPKPYMFPKQTSDDLVKKLAQLRMNYQHVRQADCFLGKLADDVDKTYMIIEAFYNAWCCREPPHSKEFLTTKIQQLGSNIKKWLDSFLSYHIITLALNSRSIMEQKNLAKSFNLVVRVNKGEFIMIQGDFPELGEVLIFRDHVVLLESRTIIDRGHLLMMKDIAISRFQALFTMHLLKDEYTFSDKEVESLRDLYLYGDLLLTSHGVGGYDSIKMIEPLCNKKMCELGELELPLMPKFESFGRHVTRSCEEMIQKGQIELLPMIKIVDEAKTVQMTLAYYSCFRHWGHPDIDVLGGLAKLEGLVNSSSSIDSEYAEVLASDLAYKVLKTMFKRKKKWFVNPELLPNSNPLKEYVLNNTWPTKRVREEYGDNWHKLPLVKCFEIPDMVDPSMIYSDKAHSIQKHEIITHLKSDRTKPIPTRRVLKTLLEREAINWPEFLQQVNDFGLDEDDLVIGLKPKERELKILGRMFALMSWNLRHYFVITEWLIKENFVPLFTGLTMADDLQALIKKLLETSEGQEADSYTNITISNSLDYEKWNNYQRKESNGPVFKVMGEFLGFPNLILRTHEFFENSLIYFPGRPDLMTVKDNKVHALQGTKSCWDGQKGGLEGLRQKGWSILSFLMIEREARIRNTLVKVLAQGDNQIITTHFKTDPWVNTEQLEENLQRIQANNEMIMRAIARGAGKLGLVINQDETMQSIAYLSYGKVPIFKGNILGLPLKRWSRVTYCSNDQVPSASTLLSSVSTSALAVCHFSRRPHDAIAGYHVLGLLTLNLLQLHNPAIRGDPRRYLRDAELLEHPITKIALLYLDPSLGGVGGTCFGRFIIRMFPDPITEGVSSWKLVYSGCSNPLLKNLCVIIGNPDLAPYKPEHFEKLIEAPESLNIPKGISAVNMIKEQIKTNLQMNSHSIKNQIIKDAARHSLENEGKLFAWLRSIQPVFPRFVSEFANCTYYGLTMSLLSIFSNSRTIRNVFKSKCYKEVDTMIVKSEVLSFASILKITKRVITSGSSIMPIWKCSSSQADMLRRKSWNCEIIGTTVPHPFELLEVNLSNDGLCPSCSSKPYNNPYVAVLSPKGIPLTHCISRGPYPPYTGSSTSEGSSIIQPWEKASKIPIIKRASSLRNTISWFVDEKSNLAKSILNNLESLTGESWGKCVIGFKRTGSPLHRFKCSRVSSGGYTACSPSLLTWVIVSTDMLKDLGDENFDFMFQPLMLYAQTTTTSFGTSNTLISHYHIRCKDCIRVINEPVLESGWTYTPQDVSNLLKRWRPETCKEWGTVKTLVDPPLNQVLWEDLSPQDQHYSIGLTIGFCYADITLGGKEYISSNSLFPLGIREKLSPIDFFPGLVRGLKLGGCLHITHRRSVLISSKASLAMNGAIYYLVEEISKHKQFLQFVSHGPLSKEILRAPHKIPSSYPLNTWDTGSIVRTYLKRLVQKDDIFEPIFHVWVFADLRSIEVIGALGIAVLADRIIGRGKINKLGKERLKEIQQDYVDLMNEILIGSKINYYCKALLFCDSELRHAVKYRLGSNEILDKEEDQSWNTEWSEPVDVVEVMYTDKKPTFDISLAPHCQNPTISGIRLFQCATGAHYKLNSILDSLNIDPRLAIVGGDGSGGLSALLLRRYPFVKVIYNSLLCAEGISFQGSRPAPPSAVIAMGKMADRCCNLSTVWREPSDLRKTVTWEYLLRCVSEQREKADLIILDMEVTSEEDITRITENLVNYLALLAKQSVIVIFKTYFHRLCIQDLTNPLCILGKRLDLVKGVTTKFSSFMTSEVYLVGEGLRLKSTKDIYPDAISIKAIQKITKRYKSFHSECDRAFLLYRRSNKFTGVPRTLIPDPFIDLGTLFVVAGIETGIASTISDTLRGGSLASLQTSLLTFLILLNESLFRTCHKTLDPAIPSTPSIRHL